VSGTRAANPPNHQHRVQPVTNKKHTANSGIGLEWASQLMAKGTYHVLVCARSTEKGEAAIKDLQSKNHPGTCELVQLDQTDDASIAAAAAHVGATHGRLDVLINNAAIASKDATRADMTSNFTTNTLGPWFVTQAFKPLLLKSAASPARVVNVSTGMGSVAIKLDHSHWVTPMEALPYRVSKTALSMVTAQCVYDFRDEDVKFFTVCPGFTVSNLGEENSAENGARPTDEAVKGLMGVVEGERDADAGKFLHEGGLYDW
jgi:NAD(P)-dependent dehydrogenase (short-subunit alcohol dehydrogenase family)